MSRRHTRPLILSASPLGALVLACLALAALALQQQPAPADDSTPRARTENARDEHDFSSTGLNAEQQAAVLEAISKGQTYLAAKQGRDGRVGDGSRGGNFAVATTSLAGLAFLGGGSTYNRGPFAKNIRAAVGYILSNARKTTLPLEVRSGKHMLRGYGYFFNDGSEQGRMHGHGFATLFLAEVFGTLPRDLTRAEELHEKLRGGLLLSLASQTEHGGWGYHHAGDGKRQLADEASVTITQIQAMRAGHNAGFDVPSWAIDRAVDYVRRCMNPDGGCRYSLGMSVHRVTYELTGAAVSTLNASGVYASKELERGMEFLRRHQAASSNPALAASDYYYYGNFYAAQAMWQAGPDRFSDWFSRAHQDILLKKHVDPLAGWYWESPRGYGRPYATAMGMLMLEIPLQYLPIFQR